MAIYNDESFVEKVKELAKEYGLEAHEKTVGEDTKIPIRIDIEKARIEITLTAIKCTVINQNNQMGSGDFEKTSEDWPEKALDCIKACLEHWKQGTL